MKDELRNAAYSFKHNRAAQIRSDARKRRYASLTLFLHLSRYVPGPCLLPKSDSLIYFPGRYERQSKESLLLEELERRDGIVAKTFER